jgi:hypothetical protein
MVAMGTRRIAPIVVGTLALAILLAIGCGSQDATLKQSAKQASPQRSAGHATQATRQTAAQHNTGHTTGDPVFVAAADIANPVCKFFS